VILVADAKVCDYCGEVIASLKHPHIEVKRMPIWLPSHQRSLDFCLECARDGVLRFYDEDGLFDPHMVSK
jgi:hypothetical protein